MSQMCLCHTASNIQLHVRGCKGCAYKYETCTAPRERHCAKHGCTHKREGAA